MSDLELNEDAIQSIYDRVVESPNKQGPMDGFIRCPDCDEDILMIPTLRVMSEAIENHVQMHKMEMKTNPIKAQQTAIIVRLSLMGQVLEQSCKIQLP